MPGPETTRDREAEEAYCMMCGRTAEIEALADSCACAGCPLNALFDAVPLLPENLND